MKRSEMLKVIEKALGYYNDKPKDMVAENILCHIEQAGMLPPENPIYNSWDEEDNLSLEEYKDAYNKGYIKD